MGDLDPNILTTIAIFAAGFVISEWRSGRAGHSKAIQVDAEMLARLANVETWQRDHNSIHGCVRELAATVKAMSGTMDRLTSRLDAFMAAHPMELRRSPYDIPPMRDWVRKDEQ